MDPRAYRWLIPLAALLAVLPLIVQGPSCGHDFDFHLLSWLEAGQQLAHGGWPRWAFTPAWNAGEPRFVFYPPLSWVLGGSLGMVLPWAWVPAAYTWVALTAAGLTMRAWLSRIASPAAALLGSTYYLANPYLIFTAYERTAYAELLAAAWLPLLMIAVLDRSGGWTRRVFRLALPIGLLWLTNAPAAVMGCYAVLVLLALELGRTRRWQLLAEGSAGVALGLALAGVYLVPAVWERGWVQTELATAEGMRPGDHVLFHRMPAGSDGAAFHDAVVLTASWVALGTIATALALCGLAWRRRQQRTLTASLALVSLGVLVLLTPPSLPVWAHLPELRYLQFPWRLTALVGVCAATAGALTCARLRAGWALAAPLMAAILAVPGWHGFRQACDVEDALPPRVALFHSSQGSEPTDEYTPNAADPEALHEHDPPWWLTTEPDGAAPAGLLPGPAPLRLRLQVPVPEWLVLNRRAYPLWTVQLNGRQVTDIAGRNDGLVRVALPAGTDVVELRRQTPWDTSAGWMLSLGAFCGMAALAGARRSGRLDDAGRNIDLYR